MFRTRSVPGLPIPAAVTVVVEGEIDLGESGAFRDAIVDCLEPSRDLVVLDLTDVDYLGSAGVRDLLDAQRQLAHQGVDLCVDDTSEIVERVLTLTNVREHLPRSSVVLDLRDSGPESRP